MNNNSKNKINETIIDDIRNLYNTKHYTLVIQRAQQIMKEHGDSFIFWSFIGAANFNLGMHEEASEAFYKVITLNPKSPSGYNNYGYTFLKLGKMEKAIENFYKAISINNEYDEAYINLSIAYKEKGENEVAIQNYKKLLAFRPNNEKAHNNLGVIYREEKMFDKAS